MSFLNKLLPWLSSGEERPRIFRVDADYPLSKDAELPFDRLNPLQSCFRDNYDPRFNAIVAASTGTGKRTVAYIASRPFLERGRRVIMLAPTRSLVFELYREASLNWGQGVVGIQTGEEKNAEEKYFVVTTPESYISALRARRPWARADLMVVDEVHNILDPSRGPAIDAAIALFVRNEGKVLLMSGTLPIVEDLGRLLDADLFISNWEVTKIRTVEVHAPDDLNILKKQASESFAETPSGMFFRVDSTRLSRLCRILERHRNEYVLVFVPKKETGRALCEIFAAPFHCADLSREERGDIERAFRRGDERLLFASTTLAQGLNTPADIVVVLGTRRGSHYISPIEVRQMIGRAGRGRPEATAYVVGDKIEIFHAKMAALPKVTRLPVEQIALTLLSLGGATTEEIVRALRSTYASTQFEDDGSGRKEMNKAVGGYIRLISACGIAREDSRGAYSLKEEGVLLARYYVSPTEYVSYMKLARRLRELEGWEAPERGCVLIAHILSNNLLYQECPSKYERDILIKLTRAEIEKEADARKAGLLRYFLARPSMVYEGLDYQLGEVARWLSMFREMVKHKVKDDVPCMEDVRTVYTALKTAVVKKRKRKG